MKPLIAITCNRVDQMVSGINKRKYQTLSEAYIKAIQECGGVPVIIPSGLSAQEISRLVDGMDGFCFPVA